MNIDRPWYLDVQQGVDPEWRVLFLPIRYTNRDAQRPVNLHFEILVQALFRDQAADLPALDLPTLGATQRGVIANVALPTPLKVKPLDTEQGTVAFDARVALGFEFENDGHEVGLQPRFRATLRVTDYASGAVLVRPLDFPEST